MKRETQGMLLGLIGVVIFSLTLPMTRIVVAEFSPLLNGLGRALAAAVPAAVLLAVRREKLPTWPQLKSLAVVSLGVIVAFPVFSAWAMKTVPASHGAVVNGLQPLCVAIYAAWLSHERPSKAFWASAVAGSAIVIAFALQAGGGALQAGDLLMLVAVGIGALGYAEGARLARQIGGWQVICWALVVSAPFLLVPVAWLGWEQHVTHPGPVALKTWLAFGYVTVFSQFIGFFAWYAGLAMGGTARVGQVQLLQIFFTMAFSALFFGETVAPVTWIFAAAVIATVMLGRKAVVHTAVRPVRAA
ncbi:MULTISPECIES: DMT family transporter [Paraburkholderia]|jgi:drug/metabolite transporter (DMT)-like permease|uniref:Multidrug DMT transporter permease n=1 Tax=Paraburkholderia largidicola TaxID=3014751 RepID=A0A7I8BLM9_9BURK|nr:MULTISPECIES: DMT family transporter [Paraburkholderia]BCF89248.1 multidrug DMT transporter permease [Paraburkholderia sp. PGU16]BEU22199.1 DMT family transporter [Paraburkholderia sp. 22B1P]GJH03788.1 EamA family transporter [Paraburkholderia terrae]GJH36747.1 EamA family transporter [Paraburkholderia hospita]